MQKGPNKGKVIKNTRKLFIAKNQTIKMLTKLAAKRGGLQGCTFDVARTGDKEPRSATSSTSSTSSRTAPRSWPSTTSRKRT